MWFVLVVVHQLVEVAHVSLEGCPCRLHQVLLTCDRLPWSSVRNFLYLVSESFNALLAFPIVFLELVCTHVVLIHYNIWFNSYN